MKQILLIIALLFVVVGAFLFGWFPRDRGWKAATGWNRIPAGERPPLGNVSDLFADGAAGATIKWLGHSGFIIRWAGKTLLLDPNLQPRVSLSSRFMHAPVSVITNEIDAVCVSHAHYDHLSPSTLRRFSRIGQIIVPKGSEVYLKSPLPGEPERVGLKLGESRSVGPLTVTAVDARHNGCRHHPWKSAFKAVGYIISDGTNTVYFAGDTAYQPAENDRIRRVFQPDTAILPIGCYAPRFPFKIHHIDPREAVLTGKELGVSHVIPCHFGTYRLTLDPPSRALPVFAMIAAREKLNWSMPELYE